MVQRPTSMHGGAYESKGLLDCSYDGGRWTSWIELSLSRKDLVILELFLEYFYYGI